MTDSTKALLFNAVPLAILAVVYTVLALTLLSTLWRLRARAHRLDWVFALVYVGVAAAGATFAALVVHDRRSIGGLVWVALAATVAATLPGLVLVVRGRGRAAAGGLGRALAAEERSTNTRLELEAVARISTSLGRAQSAADVARPLCREVAELLRVGFAGVVVVDEARTRASGVYGELHGGKAEWWDDLTIDLRNEPSGIASAVFDAAPVAVFDVVSSPLVNPRLVEFVGAKSGVWVPMIAEERVTGVLAVVTTDEQRAFGADELALLTALAAEAALALSRLHSGEALSDALAENERQARGGIEGARAAGADPARVRKSRLAARRARFAGGELRGSGRRRGRRARSRRRGAPCPRRPGPRGRREPSTPRVGPWSRRAAGPRPGVRVAAPPRGAESSGRRAVRTTLAAGRDRVAPRDPGAGPHRCRPPRALSEPRSFAPEDLALAEQLARAARGVLDRSRLFEAERASRSLSQRLARAGSRLVQELDPVAVTEAVVTEAAALLDADASALTQLAGSGLVISAATGDGAASPEEPWRRLPGGRRATSSTPVSRCSTTTFRTA